MFDGCEKAPFRRIERPRTVSNSLIEMLARVKPRFQKGSQWRGATPPRTPPEFVTSSEIFIANSHQKVKLLDFNEE
ncbi:hypothetical protein CEXT_478871 [Caerostris extrusa]|uniref:Uncharacterized protein n=1 Tax=Caerostris extrusa TaxID=172846 RepID=A0AAV4TV61_CAEEX|nr:hypothetical protein CEXT_478871 [Caerostris extrusa]